jgi:RNA-binding protein
MPTLTSKQRAHLRKLAHGTQPTLHVGKGGVTDASVTALRDAFRTRELVKLRILEAAPAAARDVAHALAEAIDGAAVVQVTGRTAVLYREHADGAQIKLPQ